MHLQRPATQDPVLAMLPEIRGRRILHPCVLYARLGRGGMGAVYLGKHLTLLQKQVVKCLWLMGSGTPTDESLVERFHQEARIAAAMTHQNLVRVTHIDRRGELHYLVMEYIDGEDVERRLRRRGRFSTPEALGLLAGAASGLGYAHARGIVHRDIKPANLMISTHGEVKVIDLGLARALDTQRQLGATIGTLGTPLFMAPEQWQSPAVGPEADVWALGAVLHYVLTARSHLPEGVLEPGAIRQFVCEQPFPVLPDDGTPLGREAGRILARCVARDPQARYRDARELAADLLRCVSPNDAVLAAHASAQVVDGDEPDEAELRALQEALQQGSESELPPGAYPTAATGADATRVDAPTLPPPGVLGATRVVTPRRAPVEASIVPGAPTLVPAGVGATIVRTPSSSPSRPEPAALRPRRRIAVGITSGVVAAGLALAAGLMAVPRFDPEAVQKDAMAAIYQERYADADRLLEQLEAAPAFADQARRLRIDALVKDATRRQGVEPVAALQCLARARAVAAKLLIPKDTADANEHVAATESPLRERLRAQLAASVEVLEPTAGAMVVASQQQVRVRVAEGTLPLALHVDDEALRAGEVPHTFVGAWPAPATDGPATLRVVVGLVGTDVHHVVDVPIEVKRGAVALAVQVPDRPLHTPRLVVYGTVQNGPIVVRARVVFPDGAVRDVEIGRRDGAFSFEVDGSEQQDGGYRVQLLAAGGGHEWQSDERVLVLDRRAPALQLAPLPVSTSAATLLVQGTADEASRVAAVGGETEGVATDAQNAFALPLALPGEDGPVRFVLRARDAAGNESPAAAALEIRVDRTAPRFVEPPTSSEPRTAMDEIVVRGRLDEPGTITIDEQPIVATDADGAFAVRCALPVGAIETPVHLRVAARDAAGNAAQATEVRVLVDRRAPVLLPGAPDGSWCADGRWMLRLEDGSAPCRVRVRGEQVEVGGDGRCVFARRGNERFVAIEVRDALGNAGEHTLQAPGLVGEKQPAGPAWGKPAPGSAVDAEHNLYERVVLDLGGQQLVLRLVRPLRDDELPPAKDRDAAAATLLQGQRPFYLAETELPVAVWSAFVAGGGAPASQSRTFDARTGQWSIDATADWRQPLHASLRAAATAGDGARLPVTQVSPEAARAFCAHYGLRLPSEAEWWFVTRMGSKGRYGWGGSVVLEQRANFADLALQAKLPTLAAYEPVDDGFAVLAPVDALPRAAQRHPWGFCGLLGNVAEWCTTANGRVVARGGSWLSESRDLRVDELRQDGLVTTGAWDCVGFRVARDL